MNEFNSSNYEDTLQKIKNNMIEYYHFEEIIPLRKNPVTKTMTFIHKFYDDKKGMILIGKFGDDNVADIRINTGEMKSFILEYNDISNIIGTIVSWLKEIY